MITVALLFRATAAVASRAVFLFLIAWPCLKVPALIAAPENRRRLDGIR